MRSSCWALPGRVRCCGHPGDRFDPASHAGPFHRYKGQTIRRGSFREGRWSSSSRNFGWSCRKPGRYRLVVKARDQYGNRDRDSVHWTVGASLCKSLKPKPRPHQAVTARAVAAEVVERAAPVTARVFRPVLMSTVKAGAATDLAMSRAQSKLPETIPTVLTTPRGQSRPNLIREHPKLSKTGRKVYGGRRLGLQLKT